MIHEIKEQNWNESDVGSIISYRKHGAAKFNEDVAICNIDSRTPELIGVVYYGPDSPITEKSIYTVVRLNKNSRKNSGKHIEEAGDWFYAGKVLHGELGILEKIAARQKVLSDNLC